MTLGLAQTQRGLGPQPHLAASVYRDFSSSTARESESVARSLVDWYLARGLVVVVVVDAVRLDVRVDQASPFVVGLGVVVVVVDAGLGDWALVVAVNREVARAVSSSRRGSFLCFVCLSEVEGAATFGWMTEAEEDFSEVLSRASISCERDSVVVFLFRLPLSFTSRSTSLKPEEN